MKLYIFLFLISITYALEHSGARLLFEDLDKLSGDGYISESDLRDWYVRHNSVTEGHTFSRDKLRNAIRRLDINNDQRVSYEEFLKRVPREDSSIIEQIHLSYGRDPSTSMTVMWVTWKKSSKSMVEYGLSRSTMTDSATGYASTYDVGVFGWHGFIHTVHLTGLKPNTTYHYRCVVEQGNSEKFHFNTAPLTGTGAPSVYAIYGDQGTVIPMGWAVTDQLVNDNKAEGFDLIMHVGDVCYAGTGSSDEYESIWDLWERQVQPLAAYIPYQFAVGNHEKYYNFTAYRKRFDMQSQYGGRGGNMWYSFDHGLVHWTQYSTEHDYSPGSEQYKWIEADLKKAKKNPKTQWIFLHGHRPMYCSDTAEWKEHSVGGYIQQWIEPLMLKYGVNLMVSGHMHMYERIYPLSNGTVRTASLQSNGHVYYKPAAPAHVVQGTAGVFTEFQTYRNPQPKWSATRNDAFGYGRITVFNESTLLYEFRHEFDGHTHDYFYLIQ